MEGLQEETFKFALWHSSRSRGWVFQNQHLSQAEQHSKRWHSSPAFTQTLVRVLRGGQKTYAKFTARYPLFANAKTKHAKYATCACICSKHLIAFSFTKSFHFISRGKPSFLHCISSQRIQSLNTAVRP